MFLCNGKGYTRCYNKANRQTAQYAYIELYAACKTAFNFKKETLDVYAPLAHRLGMSKIKIELEDLALKYLDPVAYEEIRQSINQKKDEREKYIRDIMDVLRENLTK